MTQRQVRRYTQSSPSNYNLVRNRQVRCWQLCDSASGNFYCGDKENYSEECILLVLPFEDMAFVLFKREILSQVCLYSHYDANDYNKVLLDTSMMIK